MMPKSLAFVDVETTGTSPARGRIIEIGIVRVDDQKVTKTFQTLLNPDRYLPPEITYLTGITNDQLNAAPSFRLIKDELLDLLTDAQFVAHNARFDLKFLQEEFKRCGESFTQRPLCTAKLSRLLFPKHRRHSLDALVDRFGLTVSARHRAYPDAQALWQFYQVLTKTIDETRLEKTIYKLTKKPSLPAHISEKHIKKLPEGPGVYIFYGSNDAVLYVGKSVHVQERVLSHFQADNTSEKEYAICKQATAIEGIATDGELGALLKESQLVKELQPIYNRKLRKQQSQLALVKTQTPLGYYTFQTASFDCIDMQKLPDILGIFKSKSQIKNHVTKLKDEFQLCAKLLHLEQGDGKCFSRHLGTCNGACEKTELPAKYNMRFVQAFFKTRIKAWPFDGPVVISQGNTGHVINNWCYCGVIADSAPALDEITTTAPFDYDVYKILSSYLLKQIHQKHIFLLKDIFKKNKLTKTVGKTNIDDAYFLASV